jgi:uncharacterized protein YdeI (BOF family)
MNAISPDHKTSYLGIFAILFFFFTGYLSNAQVGINTITPNSTLEINGSLSQKVETITATTTLGPENNTIVCNNGVTAITINLPSVSSPDCAGRIYTIKKGSMMSSTANVTIDGSGSQTIDGSETFLLSDDQGAVTIANDGTEWKIISDHLSPYPMGEVSYFSISGTTVNISGLSDGSTNMIVCAVSTPTATNLLSMPMNEFSTNSNGRLVYDGKTTRTFHIACTISATPSNSGDQYVFGVSKNGTVVTASKIIQRMGATSDTQSTAMHVVIVLAKGDYLELQVGNLTNSGGNVRIKSLNLFALGM